MKKILLAVIAVCCVAFASCTKTVQYKVQSNTPDVTAGYETEFNNFSNAISTFIASIEGQVVTDEYMISEISDIVDEYNNQHFSCELYLFKDDSKLKTWYIVKGAE